MNNLFLGILIGIGSTLAFIVISILFSIWYYEKNNWESRRQDEVSYINRHKDLDGE